MQISRHAVKRYAQRVRAASFKEANRQLEGLAATAVVEEELEEGERWLRAGDLRLVAKDGCVVTCYIVGRRYAHIGG